MAPLDAVAGDLIPMRPASPVAFPVTRDMGFLGHPEYVKAGGFAVDALGYLESEEYEDGRLGRLLRIYRQSWCEWGIRYASEREEGRVASLTLAENVHDALSYFANVLRDVGYFGRLRAWVRIDNADRSRFAVRDSLMRQPRPPTDADISFVADTSVDRLLDSPLPFTHAAMDFIWQAYGYPQSHVFTETGELVRQQQT